MPKDGRGLDTESHSSSGYAVASRSECKVTGKDVLPAGTDAPFGRHEVQIILVALDHGSRFLTQNCGLVCVSHPCNKGLSNVLVYRRGVQHLWHTARNEAIAKGGKGSRALDPVPAKSCSWLTEWQLENSTKSRQSKAAHQ